MSDRPDLVPGNMHCAKCKFFLVRTNLYVGSGTTGPGGSETEPCPNGCGPLWPVTWQQRAREAETRLEEHLAAWKANIAHHVGQIEVLEKFNRELGQRRTELEQQLATAKAFPPTTQDALRVAIPWLRQFAAHLKRMGEGQCTPQDPYGGLLNLETADMVEAFIAQASSTSQQA